MSLKSTSLLTRLLTRREINTKPDFKKAKIKMNRPEYRESNVLLTQ